MNRIPVLIDTDPGVDDSFAILLMQTSLRHEIKALTVTAGNVGINHTLRNALGLCELIGLEAPVYAGADKPLVISLKMADDIHGENGLGGYQFSSIQKQTAEGHAWDAIAAAAHAAAGELEILSLGPPTNIALALLRYPEIKKLIKRIVIMGGASRMGNTKPYSEFNFWCDPHASQILIESGIPMILVGLNATRQALLTAEQMRKIHCAKPETQAFVEFLTEFYFRSLRAMGYKDRLHIPDAVAAAVMLSDEIATLRPCHVRCVTEENEFQGRSIVTADVFSDLPPNMDVVTQIDAGIYEKLMFAIK